MWYALLGIIAILAVLLAVAPWLNRSLAGINARASARAGAADRDAAESAAAARAAIAAARDTTPFGEAFARDIWAAVRGATYGLVPYGHRDYCGHGLVTLGEGIGLYGIYDGFPTGEPIAQWVDEAAFVGFFARQSNYSVNGHDSAEPVFFTTDSWALNNQRLTREAITRCMQQLQVQPARSD